MVVGADGTEVGSGAQNTTDIIAQCGTATAAGQAAAHQFGGYTDWHLPSKDEFDLVTNNIGIPRIGSYASGVYWTSSEHQRTDYALAYRARVEAGGHSAGDRRTTSHYVLPVRSF